jgi:hypothetical protein
MRALAALLGLLLTGTVVAVLVADTRSAWPLALGVSSAVVGIIGAAVMVLFGGRRR